MSKDLNKNRQTLLECFFISCVVSELIYGHSRWLEPSIYISTPSIFESLILNSFVIFSPQHGHLDLLIDQKQHFCHRIIRIIISLFNLKFCCMLLLCYSTSLAFILAFYLPFLLLYR